MNPVPIWSPVLTKPDPSLTLDLRFSTDGAYVARKGPLPTFTRALATATFVGSNGLIQSAGADVPRIDYNPATLECLGLLLEESRTNLVTRSEDFADASWSKFNATVVSNFASAPDGSTTADLVYPSATGSLNGEVYKSTTSGISSGNTVTVSCFIKASGKNFAYLAKVQNATGADWSACYLNLTTGAVTNVLTGCTAAAERYQNGWWRLSLTSTAGAGPYWALVGSSDSAGSQANTASGSNGILVWGFMMEVGAFATSYIPTTTASVTRNADACSISGANFTSFWNQSEGTLVLDMIKSYTVPVVTAQINHLTASDGTLNNYIQFAQRNVTGLAGEVFRCEVGGSNQALFAGGPLNAINTPFRIGGAYKLNDFASAINGSDSSTDTTGTTPSVLNQLQFPVVLASNHIRSLQYYNVRKTNTELTRLTRLPTLDPALALDLQFALDAAYFSRIGPLPTFTNASTSSRTFVGSNGLIQSAATNVARIDFDPTTLVCRGLLIEEQRQNLCIWSEDVTNANWVKASTTATGNTSASPDGATTADTLAETAVTNQHYFYSPPANVTSGTTYSFSIFLKKGPGATAPDWVLMGPLAAGFGTKAIAFNVSTGAFGTSVGGMTATAQSYPNGWWRVSFTLAATASGLYGAIYIGFTNNTNTFATPTYLGVTTSNILVWGAQVEIGFGVTSYIPTTTSAFTRSADVCTITGAAFARFFNPVESSVVVKFRRSTHAVSNTTLAIDDNTVNERMINVFQSGIDRLGVTDTGGTTNNLDGGAVGAVGSLVGHAYRAKANDFAVSFNGNAPIVSTNQTMPTVNQMTLGYRNSGNYANGWIHSIQYYTNTKTNAQLQTLATP